MARRDTVSFFWDVKPSPSTSVIREIRDFSVVEIGRVKALDERLEEFFKEAGAVVPGPNAFYRESPRK